jgi:hypothetical protein
LDLQQAQPQQLLPQLVQPSLVLVQQPQVQQRLLALASQETTRNSRR